MPQVRKIAKLSAAHRAWLHRALVEHAFGDIEELTAELNTMLGREGVDMTIGKSAVGEESQRVRRAQEAIAAATRHMQLIADTSRDDADKRGEALNALVSEGMFTALLQAREAEAEPDPSKRIALMNKAALAAGRLTTTSVNQRKWRADVEQRAKAAADTVAKIAKTGGLGADQVRQIRAQILGISNLSNTTAASAATSAAAPIPAGA